MRTRSVSSILFSCSELAEGGIELVVIFSIALDIFYLLFSHNAFIHRVVESAPLVISTELASRARSLRTTEPAHLVIVVNEGVRDARITTLGLAFCTGLLLDAHAVLACDSAQRVEIHRTRIKQRLIDTISKKLSPRALIKLINSQTLSTLTGTRSIHVMSEFVRLQYLQSHLPHDLVVSLFQNPMSKTVLTRSLTRNQINICNRDMRVRIATLAIKMHNDITRRVRCHLLRECIGSISDDCRRHPITRIKLALRKRLDHHERLVLTTRALQH